MLAWKLILSRYRQFVLYCLIGASGATLDFGIYSLLSFAGLHPQIANACGYTAGGVLSFFLNAKFNFKTRDYYGLRFVAFFMVALLGWATSALTLYVAIDHLNWNKYLAKLTTIVIVVALQYNLNRLVSFRRSSKATRDMSPSKEHSGNSRLRQHSPGN